MVRTAQLVSQGRIPFSYAHLIRMPNLLQNVRIGFPSMLNIHDIHVSFHDFVSGQPKRLKIYGKWKIIDSYRMYEYGYVVAHHCYH